MWSKGTMEAESIAGSWRRSSNCLRALSRCWRAMRARVRSWRRLAASAAARGGDFLLRVLEELLGGVGDALAGGEFGVGGDHVPVGGEHACHQVQELGAKRLVGRGPAVLGDADVMQVEGAAAALEQRLIEQEPHIGRRHRIDQVAGGVFLLIILVIVEPNRAAGVECLLQLGAVDAFGVDQRRGLAQGLIDLRCRVMGEGGGVGKGRIEVHHRATDLLDAGATGTGAAHRSGAAVAGAYAARRGGTKHAHAGVHRIYRGRAAGDAARRSTGGHALHGPIGDGNVVARGFQIGVVLDSQGDGVLNRQIERAGMEQAINPAGIGEAGGWDGGSQVGTIANRRPRLFDQRHLLRGERRGTEASYECGAGTPACHAPTRRGACSLETDYAASGKTRVEKSLDMAGTSARSTI